MISVSHQQTQTSRLGQKIEPVQLLHERSDGHDLRIKGWKKNRNASSLQLPGMTGKGSLEPQPPDHPPPQQTHFRCNTERNKESKPSNSNVLKKQNSNQNQSQVQAEFSTKELKIMISQVNIHQEEVKILNIYA